MQNTHPEVAPRSRRCQQRPNGNAAKSRSLSRRDGRSGNRFGYLLVECLVSLVLLVGAAALLQLIAATTSASVDRAIQTDHALATVDVVHQRWLRAVCAPGGVAENGLVPPTSSRLVIDVAPVADGVLHHLTIRAAWGLSLFGAAQIATTGQVQRQVSTASRCDP